MTDTERPWAQDIARKTIEHELRNHVIKQEQEGLISSWLCRNPDSSVFWFRVIVGPNLLVFTGDIGDLIVTPRTEDVLAWVRGALDSPGYFAEKVAQGINTSEFDKELVRLALRDERLYLEEQDHSDRDADWQERMTDLEELEGRSFSNEQEFHEAFYDSSLYIDELPVVSGLSDRFYLILCALRWFVTLRQKPPAVRLLQQIHVYEKQRAGCQDEILSLSELEEALKAAGLELKQAEAH